MIRAALSPFLMLAGLLLAGLLLASPLLASLGSPAAAEGVFAGWSVGPAGDASMDKGRRFECSGGACPPSGLACLHARTPEGEDFWRPVATKDLIRRKGMPWKEIEGWLAVRLAVLRPDLAATPAADAATWTVAEPARLVGGEAFLAKRYAATGASVPTAFWMADGRMNVLVCSGIEGEEDAAWGRIEGLVGELG